MAEYEPPFINPGIDTVWVGINTFLIFFMQLGFTFVEAGTIRHKNIQSIMMKNILDVCIGTITFWLVGYSFAFGESQGGFIGNTNGLYAGKDFKKFNSYLHFMNQWAFASTATTIISGAVAERLKIVGYMIFCFFLTLFIYPIQLHWVWGSGGWLIDEGFADFAGVNAVHMVGGAAGLVATIVIGPRIGRFDPKREKEFRPSSIPFVVLGTMVLWFCWYGFNCGTVTGIEENSPLVGLVAMNTTLGAVGGAMTCLFIGIIMDGRIDYNAGTMNLCMGILAGLVSITGSCNNIHPWSAFIIGIIGGIVHISYSKGIKKLKIDDPLDASSIHFACGIWGGLATGIFSIDGDKNGLIYGGGLIGIQALGILLISVWTIVLSLIVLLTLKKFDVLRASEAVEEKGFDNIYEDDENEEGTFFINLERRMNTSKSSDEKNKINNFFTPKDLKMLQHLKKLSQLAEKLHDKGIFEENLLSIRKDRIAIEMQPTSNEKSKGSSEKINGSGEKSIQIGQKSTPKKQSQSKDNFILEEGVPNKIPHQA